MDVCKVEGCKNEGSPDYRSGRRYLRRGWCHNHYERWRRNGDPTVDGIALYADKRRGMSAAVVEAGEKECKVCKQTKPLSDYYTNKNGWAFTQCKLCWNADMKARRIEQALRNPKPKRVKTDHGECAFEGCSNKGKTHLNDGPEGWHCTAHWMQWNKHHELKPLKQIKKSIIDDDFRICTKCDRVKPQGQFHARTGRSGRQSTCKECQGMQTRFNVLIKHGRVDEARAVWESMPESLQKHYAPRLEADAA